MIWSLRAHLHDQSFHKKLGPSFWQKIWSKENFVKVIPFTRSNLDQSFYPKLPFGSCIFKKKQTGWIRTWFWKDILIGQFPSKPVKVFRKIGWVSIPWKYIKVFDACLHKDFVKENFDQLSSWWKLLSHVNGSGFMVFNATFNNISVISWRSVLLVEKTTDLLQVTDKLYHTMLYTSPWLRFELV